MCSLESGRPNGTERLESKHKVASFVPTVS